MNKKAEAFKAYLEEKDIKVFEMEELEGDSQQTVVFRSHITTEGQQLPTIVILDESIFALIRVQISPKALTEANQQELLKMINDESAAYKPFKLYLNQAGDLMLDLCLVIEDELKGDTVYTMFSVIINYLDANYRKLMKRIWQGD
ncbi:hypothetical protein [Anaerovibrio sp.]|uniref:hypothetical protein n=1 Tax=Anaerovibrio sp. TaxID=1872532 RepID=UPI001B48FAFC|nr:hypothetical protein [Anaerovibrio sp.]MBP3232569.1 hypothetical protein [Anaerovibrio sp.]MBR2143507.1 hypothetical protein [Anaerovibrio sp.]